MTTATKNHDFCVATSTGSLLFVSVTKGDDYANLVLADRTGDMVDTELTLAAARNLYRMAKADGQLLSTEAGQSVIDGEAQLVRLTQKGRSFTRAVKGSPFRYAQSCARRSGIKTGYDVLSA